MPPLQPAYEQTACLDDRRDELNEEAWQLHEGGVESVEVVHDQSLDMRSIMVLIRHDHEMAIAQLLHISVHLHVECEISIEPARKLYAVTRGSHIDVAQ